MTPTLDMAMQVAAVLGWLLLAMIAGGLALNAFDRYAARNYARVLAVEHTLAVERSARCRHMVERHTAIMSRRRRRSSTAQTATPDQPADQPADQPVVDITVPVVTDAGGRVLPPVTLLSEIDRADMKAMIAAGLSGNLIIRRFGGDRNARLKQITELRSELGVVPVNPAIRRMPGRQTASIST